MADGSCSDVTATSSSGKDRLQAGDDDSSGSDGETEPAKSFHRRISTSKAIKKLACIKEGYLMKQVSSFQRWRRRYFKLKSRKLYYGKDAEAVIFDEIDLTDISIAECSTKNANHSFQVISPSRSLILSCDTRRDMEEWMAAIKSVANREYYEGTSEHHDFLSGQHNWCAASHARPTYCNVCRETLSGVTSHGLSCEVCKFKAHKKCAIKALSNCKWSTLASVDRQEIIEEEDGSIVMPHQWLEGNLPVSAKCAVCDKNCGSVLRLQDWRCLWCRAMVHTGCKSTYPARCPLGLCRISVVPPVALHNIGTDEWEATRPMGCSPLLVFVNSKSGEGLGVKFLRRFKQLLNPAQVFDIMTGGPGLGLRLFRAFNPFRILVCGGDGSVGWVLAEIDKLNIHNQCQIGVLPLGTGNDLARVLEWGSVCDDDAQLSQLLEKYEKATIKMLDRWSIMTMKRTMPAPRKLLTQFDPMSVYEDCVVSHLTKILQSDQHSVVISSAKVLCETIKDFMAKIAQSYKGDDTEEGDSIAAKCAIVDEKLDSLLKTLHEESVASSSQENSPDSEVVDGSSSPSVSHRDSNKADVIRPESKSQSVKSEKEAQNNKRAKSRQSKPSSFIQKEALMSRANSLKKAVREIIEHTEKAVDEQNAQTKKRLEQSADVTVKISDFSVDSKTKSYGERGSSSVLESQSSVDESDNTESGKSFQQVWAPASIMDTLKVMPTIESVSVDSSRCSSPLSPIPQSPFELSPLSQSPCSPYICGASTSPVYSASDLDESGATSAVIRHASDIRESSDADPTVLPPSDGNYSGQGSPTATRRISSGSTLKPDVQSNLLFVPVASSSALTTSRSSQQLDMVDSESIECQQQSSLSPTSQQPQRQFPIINPLVSLPMWPSVNKDSLIGKVLLANADALCAAASPLMDTEEMSLAGFNEDGVMNNYFGIGLDAKILLDFHQKREEHPEKCRSRTKNLMWYGVLGGRELLQRSFKNLEQRVLLECDGKRIPLPSLQGIVILNINSYACGTNFWGGKKENDLFYAQSFNDKILEVVAVFGTAQMAASRVINLQHHRIAQCRSVRITILGEEGVPIHVDGEAWIQPPGYICIVHKNRTQMLYRNRHLETSLKMWQEKQRMHTHLKSTPFTDDEVQVLGGFVDAVAMLVRGVKVASMSHSMVEQYLHPMASQTATYMDRLYCGDRMIDKPNIRLQVTDLVNSVRQLHVGTANFLQERIAEENLHPDLIEKLSSAVSILDVELKKCVDINNMIHFQLSDDEPECKRSSSSSKSLFKLKFKKTAKHHHHHSSFSCVAGGSKVTSPVSYSGGETSGECSSSSNVQSWSTDDVAAWLEHINMEDYKDNFIRHDIRGSELVNLERRDLKELGITKVGHIKRLLLAIKSLS